jgi:hypothetical protein
MGGIAADPVQAVELPGCILAGLGQGAAVDQQGGCAGHEWSVRKHIPTGTKNGFTSRDL